MISKIKNQFGFALILMIFFLFGSFTRGSLAMTTEEEKKLGKKIFFEMERQVEMIRDPTFLNRMYKIELTSIPKIPGYLLTHAAIENRLSFLESLLQNMPKPIGPFKTVGNFRRIQMKTFVLEREPHVAISHFQSMVDANSQDSDGYYGLGLAYKKIGRSDKSVEALQSGRSLVYEDSDILRELEIVYFLSGKLDQTIEELEAVRSFSSSGAVSGDDLLGLYYPGRAYQEKGDFANAVPLFLKVKKEMPEYIDVHLGLVQFTEEWDSRDSSTSILQNISN